MSQIYGNIKRQCVKTIFHEFSLIFSLFKYPILDTRIYFFRLDFVCHVQGHPPTLDCEIGWTGELGLKTNLLSGKTKRIKKNSAKKKIFKIFKNFEENQFVQISFY